MKIMLCSNQALILTVGLTEFTLTYDTLTIRTLGGEAEFDLGDEWKFTGGLKLGGTPCPQKIVHGTSPMSHGKHPRAMR